MTKFIISSKSHDKADVASELARELSQRLPDAEFINGVQNIVGVEAKGATAIIHEVNQAMAVIIVIGNDWSYGDWLKNTQDYDTIAIQSAIQNDDVREVPVFVNNAQLPTDLPQEFAPLHDRLSFQLSALDVAKTADDIAQAIQQVLEMASDSPPPTPRPIAPPKKVSIVSDPQPSATTNENNINSKPTITPPPKSAKQDMSIIWDISMILFAVALPIMDFTLTSDVAIFSIVAMFGIIPFISILGIVVYPNNITRILMVSLASVSITYLMLWVGDYNGTRTSMGLSPNLKMFGAISLGVIILINVARWLRLVIKPQR